MTQLTLGEAEHTPLRDILDEGAKGEEFVIEGDGCKYHINITLEKTKQRAERIADLHPNSFTMSDDFNDEDPEINKMFYGEA